MKKTLLLASAACLFAMNANAGDWNMHNIRPYVGLDYSYSDADIDKVDRVDAFNHNFNTGSVNVGLKFNRYVSVEAFYQQSSNETKTLFNEYKTKAKYDAYGLDVYGYLPVYCDKVDLIGSVGLAQYEANGNVMSRSEGMHKSSDDGIGIRAGLGAQYNFTENWAVRALGRYTWLDLDNVNHMTEFSAGVRYTF